MLTSSDLGRALLCNWNEYVWKLCSRSGGLRSRPLLCVSLYLQDLKFPPRGMENQTNPASWPWFQLMSDALEGRLAGKAPRVTPVWTNEEDGAFGSSPPPDRDCMMVERSSVSELESMVGGDNTDADGNVTYIDASGEECSTPSDLSYKSKTSSPSCENTAVFFVCVTVPTLLLCVFQWQIRTPGGWLNCELLTRPCSLGGETLPKLPGSKMLWINITEQVNICYEYNTLSVLTLLGPSWRSWGCRGRSPPTRWQRNGTTWKGGTRWGTSVEGLCCGTGSPV